MAQEHGGVSRRARMLARRYTAIGKGAALVACLAMVLVAVLASMGFAKSGGVVVERSEDSKSQGQLTQGERSATAEGNNSTDARVLVHVDGAVVTPGVYELDGSSPRVNDAVTCAGGLTPDADTSQMNLAAPVADGEKVHVPVAGETDVEVHDTSVDQGQASQTGAAAQAYGLVNINTASEADLQRLPGVGEATSAAIVQDRTNNGPFSSPEDLMRVSGIGEKKYEKLKDQICV